MEAFPTEYSEHNLPLVFLSGLGDDSLDTGLPSQAPLRENGTQIRLASAACTGGKVDSLRKHFLEFDGSSQPWNASSLPGPSGAMRYKVKAIGRTCVLPPRKAAPAAQSTSPGGYQARSNSPPSSTELHSALSPLSPGSPVFPDGVFTPLWIAKHQHHVPAMIVAFFDFIKSVQGDEDDQIKADINAIRAALVRSGYRTKFAAFLICDRSVSQGPSLEERVTSIRRSTGLDSRSGLFFMPPMTSPAEIAAFVQGVMKTLQPLCVDVYRDLTKHARRKKGRVGSTTTVSSPVGNGAQALPTTGWNVRYEIKQGVFAEFRQEMDVAERHFSAAIDELLGPEGLLEFMPSWSPRWNDGRLLSDCLALRIIRCQLWSSATSSAVQSWSNYRFRIQSLIDRRGKGLQTYSWAAWEARWAESMGQLIMRTDLPSLRPIQPQSTETNEPSNWNVYSVSERLATSGERVPPYQNLHHPGYWYQNAARSSRLRRQRAINIPEEDRIPPGQSPASAVVRRTKSYDFYLALEPHEESPLSETSGHDHISEYSQLIEKAVAQFDLRAQHRMTDRLKLDLAVDLVDAGRYEEAMKILLPLFDAQSVRLEGWTSHLHRLLRVLRQCAEHLQAHDVLLAATYELLSMQSTSSDDPPLDLAQPLKQAKGSSDERVTLEYVDRERLCPIAVSFAFDTKDTSVGDSLGCQLSLVSCLREGAVPLNLSSVTIRFDNSKSVKIRHSHTGSISDDPIHVVLETDAKDTVSEAQANLKMQATERRIFDFSLIFKEAGVVHVTEIVLAIETEEFSIIHSLKDERLRRSDTIFVQSDGGLVQKCLPDDDSGVVTVSPKPPKVQIVVHGQRKRYYVDETIRFDVGILNGEEEGIEGIAKAVADEETGPRILLRWAEGPDSNAEGSSVPTTTISRLRPNISHKAHLLVKAPPDPLQASAEIVVEYTLSSDSATTIRKAAALELNFAAPLEATFKFEPALYGKAWPSYFEPDHGSSSESPGGIPQLWGLNTQILSLASENLVLHKAQLQIDVVNGDSAALVRRQEDEKQSIAPKQKREYSFELLTQKHLLDDRRQTTIEATLEMTWSRDEDSELVMTRIPVPRLTLPVSEPRVLCTVDDSATDESDATLHYYIENPSTHFLTFALTMEASEAFAFSGPKYQALSLAPLSRHRVDYPIVVQEGQDGSVSAAGEDKGEWIWPVLQVVDSYYQKTLRVLPGGEGVRLDEKQNVGVRIARR